MLFGPPMANPPLWKRSKPLIPGHPVWSSDSREPVATVRTIKVRTPADEAHWDAFVDTCETSTAYHHFAWNRIIARSFGHRCHYLAAIDETGAWQGVLPLVHVRSMLFGNSLVSLPFVNYGGLLANTREAATSLIESAVQLRESLGANLVELRHVDQTIATLPTRSHKVTMLLDLAPDADSQWRALNSKVRNQTRKAQSSGLRTVVGQEELLDDFYRVFAHNMRDLGSPVFPKKFFANVLDGLRESCRVIAIYKDTEIAAAGIALWFRDRLEVPWASSMRKFNALCPNNLLYWDAIRFGIDRGLKVFDFGRCTPDGGTYQFKKHWGAKPTVLHWQYLVDVNKPLPEHEEYGQKYRRAIQVWQRLPVGLSTMVGPSIRKRINL